MLTGKLIWGKFLHVIRHAQTMSAQLTAFLDAAKADTSLQEKLKAAGSPDAAVAIAEEAGFTFSSEDLLKATQDDVELEEWQLEAISGGKGSSLGDSIKNYRVKNQDGSIKY